MTTLHNSWKFDEEFPTQSIGLTDRTSLLDSSPAHEIIWTDPITGVRGFLVVHSLVGGMATGGTRMRLRCTLDEVTDLARCMTIKTAAFGLPVGGAKAGLDIDPKRSDALDVLERFYADMRTWLDEHWVTAEDMGVTQADLDSVFGRLGLDQSYHAAINRSSNPQRTLQRVRAGMDARVADGMPLAKVIGGYGVAQAALGAAHSFRWPLATTKVAVQGVGTMGGSAASYLHDSGVPVVAIADAAGTLYDPAGLDIPTLLDLRDSYGEIDRSRVPASVQQLSRESVLTLTADILIPAAYSYAITAGHVPGTTAKLIVEASNSATTPEAEELLAVRGIPVIPDFVANAGSAAWTWWLLQGFVGTDPNDSFNQLRTQMQAKVEFMLSEWSNSAVLPRHSARGFAEANYQALADTQIFIP